MTFTLSKSYSSVILFLPFVFHYGLGIPIPEAVPDPNPTPQFSQSSQQFTMYEKVQQQYPITVYQQQQIRQLPPGVPLRQSSSGNPLIPVSHYSYNITHPPRSSRPGIVLTHHQLQHLGLQQQLQQRAQQQVQQNSAYTPVILSNPNFIGSQQQQQRQQQFQQQQFQIQQQQQAQPENLQNVSYETKSIQLTLPEGSVLDPREREPEDKGIGFRSLSKGKNSNNVKSLSPSNIFFNDQRTTNEFGQQLLNQYPNKITFSTGTQIRQSRPLSQNNGVDPTADRINFYSPPSIQVSYLTTQSPLQQLKQQQRNTQSTGSFRSSLLGSSNPSGLTDSSVTNANQINILNSAIRGARVQNFAVPNYGQTPAGTQLLQRNPLTGGIQSQSPFGLFPNTNPNQRSQQIGGGNYINPSILNLGGTIITPENQRSLGQFIFTDPSNPSANNNNIPLVASSAQKIFIIPSEDQATDNLNQSLEFKDEGPVEIVVTILDDDTSQSGQSSSSSGGSSISSNTVGEERGKILTNFSLFLLPDTVKKCSSGYRLAHDGKCRLIIKLRKKYVG